MSETGSQRSGADASDAASSKDDASIIKAKRYVADGRNVWQGPTFNEGRAH